MSEIKSRSLGHFKDPMRKICVSPDGKHALVSSNEKLYIMNYVEKRTPVEIRSIFGCTDIFAYSPDGSHIVTAVSDEFNMILVELDDSRRKTKSHKPVDMLSGTITALAYSPNGKYIAASNDDNEIGVWDIDANDQVGDVCDEHNDRITSVSFSADSKYIASVSIDKTCIIWNFQTKEKLFTFSNTNFTSFAMSPDGKALAFGGDRKSVNLMTFNSLAKLDGNNLHILNRDPYYAKCLTFSPNGKLLAFGGDKDLIYIVKTESQELYKVIPTRNIHSFGFTKDSKSLITARSDEARIWYLELNDAEFLLDTVKKTKAKPYDILSMTFKTPSLNEKKTYDMVFQLDNSSITISLDNLKNVVTNPSNIKYPCKSHVPYTALNIRKNDFFNEPYLSIRTMGFTRDGLIHVDNIKQAINRYNTYYARGGNHSTSNTKTPRKKRCPNGSIRDKKTGKCIDKVTKQVVDSVTKTKTMTITKTNNNGKNSVTKIAFSPIDYKRNFDHALVFSLEERSKIVKRVVSKQVLTLGNVVSADHCQSDLNYQVYAIKEISNKKKRNHSKGKRTRSLTGNMNKKSLGRTMRNRDKSI